MIFILFGCGRNPTCFYLKYLGRVFCSTRSVLISFIIFFPVIIYINVFRLLFNVTLISYAAPLILITIIFVGCLKDGSQYSRGISRWWGTVTRLERYRSFKQILTFSRMPGTHARNENLTDAHGRTCPQTESSSG